MALGAPTAFVIKRPAAAALAARIASATAEAPLEIDVVLYHERELHRLDVPGGGRAAAVLRGRGRHRPLTPNIGGGVDTHISEHPGGRKKLR